MDDADRAQQETEDILERRIAAARCELPAGISGECASCGAMSQRLIDDQCARCRDISEKMRRLNGYSY